MNLDDLLRPALADRYEVHERLGRGGTAEVFAGVALGTGAPVALKVLHPDLARALAARRFLREVALLQRLDHPGIVPCLEAGSVEAAPGLELPWMVMPQRGPGTLRSRLAADWRLSARSPHRGLRRSTETLGPLPSACGQTTRKLQPG